MLTAWGCPEKFESIPGCTRGEPDIYFTCNNGGVGKEHLEENNVKQWDEWGFDYLKYDWAPCEPINADYMKKALLKASREIAYSVTVDADFGYREYWKRYCNSFRCNRDSIDQWHNVKQYLNLQSDCRIERWKDAVSPGHFYDLDMLEIGPMTHWNGGRTRLTENEAIFAYTLRAFFLSPIQLSCVVEQMTEFERDMVCNEEVIAVNQDSLADYPDFYSADEKEELVIYKRKLENGDALFAVFNTAEEEKTAVLDLEGYCAVRELWTRQEKEWKKDFACKVEPHCAILLRALK